MNAPQTTIYPNVAFGKSPTIQSPCIIGLPPRGRREGELKTTIGDNAVIRSFSTIYAGTTIGNGFQMGHAALLRENNVIGENVSIGSCATVEPGNRIGDNTRIHSGCFVENCIIGKNVFIGPRVIFTDDLHPPCPRYLDCKRGAIIEDNVRIGAGAVILPGVRIGAGSLIGAGSVVTENITAGVVVAGNPARVIKRISSLKCSAGYFKKPYDWCSQDMD